MPLIFLASFPNSRIKPRPARTTGDTDIVEIPNNVTTKILDADPNRVNALLRNLSSNFPIYYGYDNSVNSSVGETGGMLVAPLDSVVIDDPRDVYVFQNSGGPINISLDVGQG